MLHSPEGDYGPLKGAGPHRTRDVARRFLQAHAPDSSAQAASVLLVVTELVTNAVRHAGGVTGFRLKAGPGTVTVSVEDASRTPPHPLPADPTQPGGFGWLVVQSLATDVKVSFRPGGKTVSAVLPLS